MKSFVLGIALSVFCSAPLFAADPPPKGFDDPKSLEKIMAGEIVKTQVIDTKMETKVILRAFCNKSSTDAFIDVAINHGKYPVMFPEIQDAKTTATNAEKTQYDWWADMLVKQGFISFHVHPEGVQKITRAKDATSEATIENTLKNYADLVEVGQQNTRLIPFENGVLVEDTVYVKVKTTGGQAGLIKTKMVEQFTRFLAGFRKEIGGDKP